MIRFAFWVLVFLGTSLQLSLAQDDTRSWSVFTKPLWSEGSWTFNAQVEFRTQDDISVARRYFFGPMIRFKINNKMNLGGAFKMVHSKRSTGGFAHIQRSMIEMNYTQTLNRNWQIRMRPRFEYWRVEEGRDNPRLRYRLFVDRKVSGWANRVYSGYEAFYTYRNNTFAQNRITVIGARFPLGEDSLSLSYFIQGFRDRDGDNHVLYTSFSF